MSSELKQTEIGRVPKEWEVVRLGEISENIYYGITAKATEKDTGLKMLRTTDVKNYKVKWDDLPFCEVTEKRNDLSKYFLKNNDLVIARAGTTGVSVLVDRNLENVVFGSYLIKVRLRNVVDPEFVHYFLQSNFYWKHITSSQAGSTLKNITLPILKSLKIPLPPLPEQRRIASILSTVDRAIQRVDEAIAGTERLKRGLMQELLTRGIGHEEFKDSEIGRIPREWEVVRLGDHDFTELIMGQSPPSSTYNEKGEGLPFLQGKMEFGEIHPSPAVYCSNPIKIAKSNDILLSVRAPVGDVNIALFRCCIGRGLSAIRAKRDKLHHLFLFYYLKLNGKKFEALSAGSTFKAIRRQEIENYPVPLPPLAEQQKIAEILSTVDQKLGLERRRKEKLERIKRGLMNDLLTGRKRLEVK